MAMNLPNDTKTLKRMCRDYEATCREQLADLADSRASETRLRAELERVRFELSQSRREANRLRQQLGERSRELARITNAFYDAMLLITSVLEGNGISRIDADRLGITRRRWENARALMRLARIHNGYRLTQFDMGVLTERLEAATQTALDNPAAYNSRLPKSTLKQNSGRYRH